MNLRDSADEAAFRARVRDWLAANLLVLGIEADSVRVDCRGSVPALDRGDGRVDSGRDDPAELPQARLDLRKLRFAEVVGEPDPQEARGVVVVGRPRRCPPVERVHLASVQR